MLYKPVNIKAKYSLDTLNMPISAYMKITSKCMLNCIFCSQSDEERAEIDFDFAKQLLNGFKNNGIRYVYYTGGEPLLYPKIYELLEYGHSIGLKQIMITNGLLLNKEEHMKSLDHLVTIGISLHGDKEIHNKLSGGINCWEQIVQNIRSVRTLYGNISIDLNCTILNENSTESNWNTVLDIAKEVNATLCFGRLNFIANGKQCKADESIPKLLRYISQSDYPRLKISNCIAPCLVEPRYRYLLHGCGVGVSMISVEPNGNVKICPSSQQVIGNLHDSSIKSIWNSKKMTDFRKMNWTSIYCKCCSYLPTCKGGCHSEGSQLFWEDMCDELVLNKDIQIWNDISSSCLKIKYSEVRQEGLNKYIILSFPARKIDGETYSIIKQLNGKYTGLELVKMFPQIKVQELLISLYRDNNLEVNDEK